MTTQDSEPHPASLELLSRTHSARRLPPIRRWLLLGLLLVESVALTALTFTLRNDMQTLQLENARTIMQHVSENVLEQTRNYLEPAERTVLELESFARLGLVDVNATAFGRVLLEELVTKPQLTGLYYGSSRGAFVYAKREDVGFQLKRITVANGRRRVTFTRFDASLRPLATRIDPHDRFDPRTRSWYKAALAREALVWTGPYVFFTSQRPGITTAMPRYTTDGQPLGVFGVDIELTQLSAFISSIPTSPNGTSFIATDGGDVVSMVGLSDTLKTGSRSLPKLEKVAPPESVALQRQGLKDTDFHTFASQGKDWVGVLRPLLVNQDANWWLGIHAPQSDFVGSTETLFNRQLGQAALISAVVFLFAVPLIWRVSSPIEGWYRRATTDELTGLLNRSEFTAQTNRALRQGRGLGVVIMLDLDGFKAVNDAYGHQTGDLILQTVAQRLRRRVRHRDLIARFGGDEFALFMPDIASSTASHRLETWRRDIVAPFEALVTVSAGLVEIQPLDTLDERLHAADLALLEAKARGKNRIVAPMTVQATTPYLETMN
jgi:diguanylate cyclase (GGDEF)-like protein